MQVGKLISSLSTELACTVCCLITIAFLFVKLIAVITGSHILGIAIIVFGIYKLLRFVGTFALYPASFNYIKSDTQIRGSQRIAEQIVKNSQQLFVFFHRCQQQTDTSYLAPIYFKYHVKQMIRMLQKFQKSLSENKIQMLRAFKFIDQILNSQYSSNGISITVGDFFDNPENFRKVVIQKHGNSNQLKNIAIFSRQKLQPYMRQVLQVVRKFNPPQPEQGMIKMLMYRMYSQKLYEIRYAYMHWDQKFQYSFHLVETKKSDAMLELALIKSKKTQKATGNKCVIISCPNGAFLQYFALESQYIDMYLQMGYQIVLWNYRGYGQSTGSPTISSSIKDIQDIYNYCKRVLSLQPQISHGYSIGGPPAVSLAAVHPLKVLVVDRSFCNFVNIANEISPVLAKLARVVMISDSNVNISSIYLSIKKCRKILIWSAVDQVISNGSSLKLGILKRIVDHPDSSQSKQGVHSPNTLIGEEQLNQNQTFISQKDGSSQLVSNKKVKNEHKVKSIIVWFEKSLDFFRIVSMLYEAEKNLQQTFIRTKNLEQGFNNSLMEQVAEDIKGSSETIWKKQQHRILMNKVWEIIQKIDGGGTRVKFLRQLSQAGLQKQNQLILEVKSFILGLVYFGSSYHENRLDEENLNNWPYTIASLREVDEQLGKLIEQNKSKGPQQLMIYVKQFHNVLKDIKNYIQNTSRSGENGLGIVVPTESGHNGQLSRNQMQYLKAAILGQIPIKKQRMMQD